MGAISKLNWSNKIFKVLKMSSESSSSKDENPAYLNSSKNFKPNEYEDYGAFFYSERFGNQPKHSWYDKLFSYGASRELLQKNLCEQNVQKCVEKRKK